jgi:hypothetical protein
MVDVFGFIVDVIGCALSGGYNHELNETSLVDGTSAQTQGGFEGSGFEPCAVEAERELEALVMA